MTGVYFNNNNTFLFFNESAFIESNKQYNLFLNTSACFYNKINCELIQNLSTLPDIGFRESVEKRIQENPFIILEIIGLCCLVLATVFGNALVVLSVFQGSCRSFCKLCPQESTYKPPPSHYLIASIALADLVLGLFVLPLSCAREIAKDWYMGEVLCSFWTTLDVLSCTASIISLCAVAVDRYIGVSRPLSYVRLVTKKKTRLLILGIWLVSFLIAVGPPLGWKDHKSDGHYFPRSFHRHHTGADCHVNKELGYVIFSATGSFYIPACIVIVLYLLIYRVARNHAEAIRKGQFVANSDVTLRIHSGRNSSDTPSMMSMSSSLNASSTQDNNTGSALKHTNSFAIRINKSLTETPTTTQNQPQSSIVYQNAPTTIRRLSSSNSITVSPIKDHHDTPVNEENDQNLTSLMPDAGSLTPVRRRGPSTSGQETVDDQNLSSVVLDNEVAGYLTPVRRRGTSTSRQGTPVNKDLARTKTQTACVLSPHGNHLMPLAFNGAKKLPSSMIMSQLEQPIRRTLSWTSIGSNKSSKSVQQVNRSFRDKYFGGNSFGKEAKYRRQVKAAKTLGIVVGAFLFCWSPFFVLLPIEAVCPDCELNTIFNIALWLGYINSCINPLIYACSSRELRKLFKRALCRQGRSRNNDPV